MIYSIDISKKVIDVDISGDISFSNSEKMLELRKKLLDSINNHNLILNIDFKKVTNIDSLGIGILVSIQKKLKEYNGDLIIKNVNSKINSIFKLTKLDQIVILE